MTGVVDCKQRGASSDTPRVHCHRRHRPAERARVSARGSGGRHRRPWVTGSPWGAAPAGGSPAPAMMRGSRPRTGSRNRATKTWVAVVRAESAVQVVTTRAGQASSSVLRRSPARGGQPRQAEKQFEGPAEGFGEGELGDDRVRQAAEDALAVAAALACVGDIRFGVPGSLPWQRLRPTPGPRSAGRAPRPARRSRPEGPRGEPRAVPPRQKASAGRRLLRAAVRPPQDRRPRAR